MTIESLIEQLSRLPKHLPVMCADDMGNCGEADEIKFEGNHVRILVDCVEFAMPPDEEEDTAVA